MVVVHNTTLRELLRVVRVVYRVRIAIHCDTMRYIGKKLRHNESAGCKTELDCRSIKQIAEGRVWVAMAEGTEQDSSCYL
jgi:hypothetical protein